MTKYNYLYLLTKVYSFIVNNKVYLNIQIEKSTTIYT